MKKQAIFFGLIGMALSQMIPGGRNNFVPQPGMGGMGGFGGGALPGGNNRGLSPALPAVEVTFIALSRTTREPTTTTQVTTAIEITSTYVESTPTSTPIILAPSIVNYLTKDSQERITDNEETGRALALLFSILGGIIVLAIVIACFLFWWRRRQIIKEIESKIPKDLENPKIDSILETRKFSISPAPSTVWSQSSSLSPKPSIHVEIPKRYQLETTKGPLSTHSELSVFQTGKTITPTRTDSYLISNINREITTIEEDDESLYEKPPKSENFFEYLNTELRKGKKEHSQRLKQVHSN